MQVLTTAPRPLPAQVAYRPLLDRISLQDASLNSLFQVHLQLLALLLWLDREGTGVVTGPQCHAACRALAETYPNECAALLAPSVGAHEGALLRTLSLPAGPGGSIAIRDVADKFVLVDRLHSNQSHFPQPASMLRLRQMRQMRQDSSVSVHSTFSGGSSNASSSRSVLSSASGGSNGRSVSSPNAVAGGSNGRSVSSPSAVAGGSNGRSVSSPSAVAGGSNRASPNRDACMGEVTDDPMPPTELLAVSADVGGFEPAAGVVCHDESQLDGCAHMAPLNHRLTLGRLALLTRSMRAKFGDELPASRVTKLTNLGASDASARELTYALSGEFHKGSQIRDVSMPAQSPPVGGGTRTSIGGPSSGTLGAVSGATRKQATGRGSKPYGVMSARLDTNLKLPPRARGLDRSDAMLESMDAEDEAHGTFGLSEQSLEPENELEEASYHAVANRTIAAD